MKFLHTMVRVQNLDQSMEFYCDILDLKEVRRYESEAGRFTLVYLAGEDDMDNLNSDPSSGPAPCLELTYNWDTQAYDGGRNFGHLAYAVDNIYETCQMLLDRGIPINRPPRDGRMAFIRSPELISIEFLQKGDSLAPAEPWLSMENTGEW